MDRFKEPSPTSGNIRLKARPSELAQTPSPSRLTSEVESTAISEHPKIRVARELESNERVGLIFRHWLSLIVGVSIGVALVIGSQVSMKVAERSTPMDSGSISVTVLNPNADSSLDTSSVVAAAPQSQGSLVTSVNGQEEPSHIIEHAQARSIQLAERKFLFSTGTSMRSYDPRFVSSDANGKFNFSLGEAGQALALRPINDNSGRYELSGTAVQWQGAWQANNPEQNIKLGSAYLDYVTRTFGGASGSTLSALNKEPSSLLSNMPRKPGVPGQMRSYRDGK